MFVFRNLLITIIRLLYAAANIFEILLIIRAVMSWFMPNPYNRFYQILIQITEPVLYQIRRFLPRMSIDFSPMIAILIIEFIIKGFILISLAQLVANM
ncbi:MAG: YggT family protein [Candidatus Cloacimonetes bacterium]|nr:YggT family protein [Candidatus Cloacimonadota bacterium]